MTTREDQERAYLQERTTRAAYALLDLMKGAGAFLLPIPGTEHQQYVAAGTLENIGRVIMTAEAPVDHGHVLRTLRQLLDGSQPKDVPAAVMVIDRALANGISWSYDVVPPQGFVGYVKANYNGDVNFHDPEWHAVRLWNAAMKNAGARLAAPASPAQPSAAEAQVVTEEWSYSTDEEHYHDPEPSRIAIIQHALAEVEAGDDSASGFWIGKNVRFVGQIDAGWIIEQLQEQAYDECGEWAETYLEDVTKDEEAELESLVNAWASRMDRSNFWTVKNTEFITIEQAREIVGQQINPSAAAQSVEGGKQAEDSSRADEDWFFHPNDE